MRFCFHKWSPWSDPVQTYNNGHKQQWRTCLHCNKASFRTMWWDKMTSISLVSAAIEQARALAAVKEAEK